MTGPDRHAVRLNPSMDDLAGFIASVRPVGDKNNRLSLAKHFQKMGRHWIALEQLIKILDENPADIRALNAAGISYDCLGRYDLAEKAYTASLQLDGSQPDLLNNMGYSRLLQGKFSEAAAAFRKAIAMAPDRRIYHNNLGLAYARLGQQDMAFNEFKAAGGETAARHNLAQVLNSEGTSLSAETHGSGMPGLGSRPILVAEAPPRHADPVCFESDITARGYHLYASVKGICPVFPDNPSEPVLICQRIVQPVLMIERLIRPLLCFENDTGNYDPLTVCMI